VLFAYNQTIILNLTGNAEAIARGAWLNTLHLNPALQNSRPFMTGWVIGREFDRADQEFSGGYQRLAMTEESATA
jgi:hypothetical protein